MSWWTRITSTALVILVGVLASVLCASSQGNVLQQEVDQYPSGATRIFIQNVAEDQSANVLSILAEFAASDARAIVRVDDQLGGPDGGLTAVRIGLVADPADPPTALDFGFLGTTLFGTTEIADLLASGPTKSIGLDASAADVLSDIPELSFAPRISVVKLARLIETSGTANGVYRIVGADRHEVADLLNALEPVTGQTSEGMLTPLQGSSTSTGLFGAIVLGLLIAAWVLLLVLLVFEALRSYRVLGAHLLLGKSARRFAASLFQPVLLTAALTMILSATLTLVLMRGYAFTLSLLTTAASAAAVEAILVLSCVGAAAVLLLSIKPVDAILERYSKRAVLGTLSAFYVVAVAALTLTAVFLDGPLRETSRLASISQTWDVVASEKILYSQSAGDDQASFTGQSSQYARDFYAWYESIADEPGVTLVNVQRFDRQVLEQWAGVFTSVPERAFQYIAASPSYLASQGFPIDDDLATRAQEGERVFLLPDTWSHSERTAMQRWLDEDSHAAHEPAIRTRYFTDQRMGFEEYSPSRPFFAWNSDPMLPQSVADPVILILTPENMVPFESESLFAVGLENSYIKLSETAAEKYVKSDYLSTYHLDDNDIEFLPVGDFIAGLTKTIQFTLQVFGSILLLLCALSIVMLIALMRMFSTTYREALAVKRMLGYSLIRLFVPAIVVVAATGALAVAAAVIARSQSALLGNLIVLALQAAVLVVLTRRYARLQLAATLKE